VYNKSFRQSICKNQLKKGGKMDTSINEILKTLEGRVYTTRGLVNYLNKKYGGKKTQKPFNISDVCGYIYSGALPSEYGGNKITKVVNDIIGVVFYEID